MKTQRFILLLSLLFIVLGLNAQIVPSEKAVVIPDSLLQLREQQIAQEFGFGDKSTLSDACTHLKVDISQMKEQLNLEVDNQKLDNQTLLRLGISPYTVILAKETLDYGFNELSTLLDVAKHYALPIKKLKHLLGLNPNDKTLNTKSLQALDKSIEDVTKAEKEFRDTMFTMGANITLVGMLVVFSALILTSIVILQLRHLNREKPADSKPKVIKLGAEGEIKSLPDDISNNDIVAVITALHIYTQSLEERRKLALTFSRASANYWHAAKIVNMPNREFSRNR